MVLKTILYFSKYSDDLKGLTILIILLHKGLSDESIESPSAHNNILDCSLEYLSDTIREKFYRIV